ncbi:CDP-glycerol glycerophosphotransferase family protein [Chloroflexota bacterium]
MRLIRGIAPLLMEIAAYYRFFWKTPKVSKAIVLYAEHEGYYSYFEGLIEELVGEHNRSLCYVTSDLCDPILLQPEAKIKAFYLNKLLPLFMAHVSCGAFVMTLTDLHQLHLKRSLNPVHYVYVFHALVSTHMIYRYGAFDHYDSILCCGPHHVEEIRRHEQLNGLRPKTLVEAGYHRLERIHKAYQERLPEGSHSVTKKCILIAPSWGVDNILESCGERLVETLLEAGYEVIVRPHPETVRRSPELIALFASRFGGNPDFTLEMSVSTDDSLLRADVLISDYSGVALEYAFGTERPVLFLDVPAKINNPRFGELAMEPLELSLRSEIGVVVHSKELEAVPEVISDLIMNRTAYKGRIAELRRRNVYTLGHSSAVGAEHIVDIVSEWNG